MDRGTWISLIGHGLFLVAMAVGGTLWPPRPMPIRPMRVRFLPAQKRAAVAPSVPVKPTVRATPTARPKPTSAPPPTTTPKPTARPKPTTRPKPTARPKPTGAPKPTLRPKATRAPKPTLRPKATSAPKPTLRPKPTSAPKPAATAKPTARPVPRPTPRPIDFGLSLEERLRRRWAHGGSTTTERSADGVPAATPTALARLDLPEVPTGALDLPAFRLPVAPASPTPPPLPTAAPAAERESLGLSAEGGTAAPDWYLELVERRLAAAWKRPAAVGVVGSRRCAVRFRIRRDGSLGELSLRTGSGWSPLDRSALEAVRGGAPYEALPDDFGDEAGELFTIVFHLEAAE